MKTDLEIYRRVERNWTHYDLEFKEVNGNYMVTHRSRHYGIYSPPYPAHYTDEKFDGKIQLQEIYNRVFRELNGKFYNDYSGKVEIEIQNVKMFCASTGRKLKFELIK
jgi:hypothetical protein